MYIIIYIKIYINIAGVSYDSSSFRTSILRNSDFEHLKRSRLNEDEKKKNRKHLQLKVWVGLKL